ncbi:MAG TPA: SulP family inorganic anion transporter [Acidimicrobiia bacterium]|nr:SulP family inorganic anion transporter [Acidimicrobiia bacterium]
MRADQASDEATVLTAAGSRLAVGVTGLMAGLILVTALLSFASLIYSRQLAPFLPLGTVLILAGAALVNVVGARMSSLGGSILIPQDTTTALIAATLAVGLIGVAPQSLLGTALAIIVAGTLLTALVLWALGWRRAGDLVRFVPVPVMGGFLAGTGWILLVGAADLATGGFEWSPVTIVNLAAALAIGLTLTTSLRRSDRVTIFPLVILGSVVVFYVVIAITGVSLAEARNLGLLPGAAGGFQVPSVSSTSVDWGAVAASLPRLAAIPVVAGLALLMNVGGLELLARRDADLNRELQTAGWANLAAAFTATPVAYHTLGISAVAYRLKIHSRAMPLIVALVAAAAATVGPILVSGLPLAVAGGLLTMVGTGFLADWLVDARPRMPAIDYVLMLGIVVVIAMFGFLAGILFGMAAAVILFTVKYSRLDPIRHTFTARERSSSIDRSPAEQERLGETAASIRVAELEGFLFFGTAHTAVRSLEERIRREALRFLVIDLRRVEGFDSTAAYAFSRLRQTAAESDVLLVFTHTASQLRAALEGIGPDTDQPPVFIEEIDQALEWCETQLLSSMPRATDAPTARFFPEHIWSRLEPHMERIDLEENGLLADLGEDADSVFLVEHGRVAVELPIGEGRWQRIRSVRAGNLLGELSLYVDGGRSARLRAETASTVFRLSPEGIAELEANDPHCAVAFHRAVGSVMAERLTATNDFVRALVR